MWSCAEIFQLQSLVGVWHSSNYVNLKVFGKQFMLNFPPKSPRIQRLKFGALNQKGQEEHFLILLSKFSTYLSSQSQQDKAAMQGN